MWHQHRVDPYFGALFITLFGASATLFIVHTIHTMPDSAFQQQNFALTAALSQ